MSRRDDMEAEIVALAEELPEQDWRAFCYMVKCLAEEHGFGTIITPVRMAEIMLDAARDTRNAPMIRFAEENLERVRRS